MSPKYIRERNIIILIIYITVVTVSNTMILFLIIPFFIVVTDLVTDFTEMEGEKMNAAKTVKKQRGIPFAKGKSGNPTGRPQGSRNKATIAALELLEGEAEKLTRKAINLALKGDTTALKLCISRIIPLCHERPLKIDLPAILSAEDLPKLTAALLDAVGQGKITPSEASALSTLVTTHARSLEIMDFEKRLTALEAIKEI